MVDATRTLTDLLMVLNTLPYSACPPADPEHTRARATPAPHTSPSPGVSPGPWQPTPGHPTSPKAPMGVPSQCLGVSDLSSPSTGQLVHCMPDPVMVLTQTPQVYAVQASRPRLQNSAEVVGHERPHTGTLRLCTLCRFRMISSDETSPCLATNRDGPVSGLLNSGGRGVSATKCTRKSMLACRACQAKFSPIFSVDPPFPHCFVPVLGTP